MYLELVYIYAAHSMVVTVCNCVKIMSGLIVAFEWSIVCIFIEAEPPQSNSSEIASVNNETFVVGSRYNFI